MRTATGAAEFEWMLNYELLLAERYRRFLAVAMVKSAGKMDLRQLLGGTLRSCDVYFELGENFGAVLLSETDASGALTVLDRFKRYCEGQTEVHCAVGSYPRDGLPAERFTTTLYARMQAAEGQEPGAVVTKD